MDGEIKYQETFTRTVLATDVQHKLNGIYELYTPEEGWVVGTPKITPAAEPGYVVLEVPLTKYALKSGRRM